MSFEEALTILGLSEVRSHILMLAHHFRGSTSVRVFQSRMIESLRDTPDVQQALQVV